MKHGCRPTREQRKLLGKYHLNPADWLIIKDTSADLHIVHRYIESTKRIIPKEI